MSSAKRPQRRGVHLKGRSVSEGPAGRENLSREEGLRKVDGAAVTDKSGTRVEHLAQARGNFSGRPVERAGAEFTQSMTRRGMVTVATNAGSKETEG